MKVRIIKLVTFLGGIYFFVVFILPKRILIGDMEIQPDRYNTQILNGVAVVGSMAIGLGVINLVRIHGYTLLRLSKGWIYSFALLGSMFLTIIIGLLNWYYNSFQEGQSPLLNAIFWQFIFSGIYNNLASAMFSLLAFYIAYAAYRSFRIQNLEAGLMMAAAIIVMLGQIPLGVWITQTVPMLNVLDARAWVMKKINVPVFRAILFGSLIAGLGMAVRMWFSLQNSRSRN